MDAMAVEEVDPVTFFDEQGTGIPNDTPLPEKFLY